MTAPTHPSTLVVAVDGPSGSGKSSVSRAVARRFGLRYLDTGAMYRALAWWMLAIGVDVHDASAVAQACESPEIAVTTSPEVSRVRVDGHDVTTEIRSAEVTAAVSPVSAVPEVRERLVEMQRAMIGVGGIVVEGRDIGSVVAPEAAVKVFLTASTQTRAQRRHAELTAAGSVDQTERDLARRDHIDSTRAASPLTRAPGAVVIDATELTLAEVTEAVSELVQAAGAALATGGPVTAGQVTDGPGTDGQVTDGPGTDGQGTEG